MKKGNHIKLNNGKNNSKSGSGDLAHNFSRLFFM